MYIRLLLNLLKYYVACLCGYHATTESPMDGTTFTAASLHMMVEWLEFGESLCFRIRAEFLCPWEH